MVIGGLSAYKVVDKVIFWVSIVSQCFLSLNERLDVASGGVGASTHLALFSIDELLRIRPFLSATNVHHKRNNQVFSGQDVGTRSVKSNGQVELDGAGKRFVWVVVVSSRSVRELRSDSFAGRRNVWPMQEINVSYERLQTGAFSPFPSLFRSL